MKVRQWITAIVLLLLVAAAIVGLVWTRALPVANEELRRHRARNCWGGERRRQHSAGRPASAADGPADGGAGRHSARAGAGARGGKGWRSRSRSGVFRCAAHGAAKSSAALARSQSRLPIARTRRSRRSRTIRKVLRSSRASWRPHPNAQKDNLQDQIDVAKAQMDLDQDELDDATEDLEQAGGDPQSKIKRLQAEHEAGDHDCRCGRGIGGESA